MFSYFRILSLSLSLKKIKIDFSVEFDDILNNKIDYKILPIIEVNNLIEYNQWKNKYTKNACFLYSFITSISNNYWIKISDNVLKNILEKSEKDWIFYPSYWAKFWESANYLAKHFSNILNLKLDSITFDIISEDFQGLIDKWYFVVLWIKKANKIYFKEIDDWKIDNIDFTSYNNKWHLHTYYKDLKTGKYFIVENYHWYISNNIIELPIKLLKNMVTKWYYYRDAKIILPKITKSNFILFEKLQNQRLEKPIDIDFLRKMIKNDKI